MIKKNATNNRTTRHITKQSTIQKQIIAAQSKALYLSIAIDEVILNDIIQHNILQTYFDPCAFQYVNACYIKMTGVDKIINKCTIPLSIHALFEHIITSIPHIQECTFEFLDRDNSIDVLESLIRCIYDNHSNTHSSQHSLEYRISLPISLLKTYKNQLQSLYAKYPSSHYSIDISFIINEQSIADVKNDIHTLFTHNHDSDTCEGIFELIHHISVEWDFITANTESIQHYMNDIITMLQNYGLYQYQIWHFARKKNTSLYLSHIYALHSYLGLVIGKEIDCKTNKDDDIYAVSWIEGNEHSTSYMGTMHAGMRGEDIIWDSYTIEEELALRIMQAQCTTYLDIPAYVFAQYMKLQNTPQHTIEQMVENEGFMKHTTHKRRWHYTLGQI